jgi:hypothetical protein
MRLSLRSLSSFFCLSFCSFAVSFANRSASFVRLFSFEESFESLFSACKLLLELDPFNNEGSPRLNTDDFFCAEAGVECEGEFASLEGEELAFTRDCAEKVGEDDVGSVDDAGMCIDWEDERRKNGMEEGVRRLCD